ncbi:Vmc-like lipoprotein signal peptide domain-containing protein [Mycoplasma sp. 48589B]
MKTILLSLVGLTAITLPAVAVACNKTQVKDDEAKEKETVAKLIKEQQVTADVNDKANMLASAVTTANVTLSGYNAEMFSSVVNSVEAIQNTVKVAYTLKSIKFNDITANGEVVITGFKEPEAQVNPVTGGGESNPSTDGGTIILQQVHQKIREVKIHHLNLLMVKPQQMMEQSQAQVNNL